jgi:PAS domain S-box-containing protein
MDADKERQELLNELQGLKEELARLKETASEYKLQYQAIKETKDQLNIAFEASMDAIVATNQEGKITLFNQAAEELFQYSSQEVIGQPIKILLRENIGDIHQGKMDKFLSKDIGQCGHIGKRTERTFRRKGGSLFEAEIGMSGGRSSGKRMMIASIVDITERKKIEADLKKSENQYRLFLQNFTGIAYRGNIDSSPEFYHGAVKKITGYAVQELLTGNPLWKNIIYPEDLPSFENDLQKLRNDTRYSSRKEYRILHKNGQIRWVQEYVTNRCDDTGRPVYYEGTIYDITDHKHTETELIKMINLESIGTLAGGIAHDFNNLLMAVTGYISLAKTRLHPEDKAYTLLSEAERISFLGKDLTQQLITFSKGGEPSKKIISFHKLIKETAEAVLSGSNIKCKYILPENLYQTEGDGAQIRQVVNNIIVNAKEAMPRGGTITVRAANVFVKPVDSIPLPEGEFVKISIEDKGIGIAEENLSKVFDPYYTTKILGAQRGMGLGLAVVYSILKKHNGCVTVDSARHAGSTFHLYLPAYKKESKIRSIHKKTSKNTKGKILFMDDEQVIRDVAEQIIRGIGYEPVMASHGIEAIELYRHEKESGERFEAAILDLTVKNGMGGKETLKELIYIDPDIKAIISSGYTDDPVIGKYNDYGFIGAITKPYKAKELKELLEKVIRQEAE